MDHRIEVGVIGIVQHQVAAVDIPVEVVILIHVRALVIVIHLLAVSVCGIVIVGIEHQACVIGVECVDAAIVLIFVEHAEVPPPFTREGHGA